MSCGLISSGDPATGGCTDLYRVKRGERCVAQMRILVLGRGSQGSMPHARAQIVAHTHM
jgi:hypothetical protein